MKKEYWIVAAIFLFFLPYVLNFLAGPVNITLTSPIQFFNQAILSQYPLTAVEIFSRSAALVVSVLVVVEELEKRPFIKAAILMVLSMLSGFYAIQQLATGGTLTPFQWTLAFAYGGAALVPFVFYYIFRGIVKLLFSGFGGNNDPQPPQPPQEAQDNI